jgi:hypothetical protein
MDDRWISEVECNALVDVLWVWVLWVLWVLCVLWETPRRSPETVQVG